VERKGSSSGGGGGPGGSGFSGGGLSSGWLCNWRGSFHANPSDCNEPSEGGTWILSIKSLLPEGKGTNLLKNGCFPLPEECFDDVQDPCECDGNGGCVEENDEVPVNFPINIALVFELNSLLDQNLTPEQIDALAPYGNEFFQSMIDFLNANDTPEAQGFIEEVIDVFAENPSAEVDFEEKVILEESFINNDCLNSVYEKFKEGDNTISQYIENFVPNGSVSNLNLRTDDSFGINNPDFTLAGAITSEPDNFMITITFNTDPNLSSSVSNFSFLILGVEFMHEMIHAEMYRKLLSHAQQPNVPWTRPFINSLRNDFEGLADYYTRYWLELPPEQEPTSAQHQLMAEHYVDIMKDALADFDDNQNSTEYYESLSWIGLKETIAWDNLSPSDTISINTNIQNELQNEPCN
jgi:hypothetical protein